MGSCSNNKKPSQEVKNNIPTAHAYILETSTIANNIEVNGTLLPWEEVSLTSEIQGRIEQISFNEGSLVQKGQILVKINNADLIARVAQVQARLIPEEKKLIRLKSLLQSGGISQQELEQSEAIIQELNAEKLFLQSQLDKTEIRAPWTGKIGIRQVSEGAIVSPGTLIATLRQVHQVKIEFKVPERYAGSIGKGNPFVIKTDYLNGEEILGEIDIIEPAIDAATRTILVRGKVNNSNQKLFAGTSAQISLMLDSIPNSIVVPDRAIKPVIKGKEIVVMRQGKAQFIPVIMGIRSSNMVQVSGEIQAGDTILTTGMMQVKPGTSVEITKIENR
jgi:membrane fusion protein (multidrug efflux system)